MKKIIILIGNYCSGKTEIALNMASIAAAEGKRTLVVDLDRINDYFRMSDHIQMLTDRKIDVVSPTFVGKGLTQTNMPAAVASAFDQDWDLVVFDVGGDQAGALSLARYHEDFARQAPGTVEVFDIVNVFRPQAVLIGGGISAEGEALTQPLQKMVGTRILGHGRYALVTIRAASLGNDAGLVGAAMLAEEIR